MARQKKVHYLSRFFLGGFTLGGDENGFLWTSSKHDGRKWRARAREVAHIRDLFKVESDTLGSDDLEVAFASIENLVAPVLRGVVASETLPTEGDLDILLHLVALNGARPPGELKELEKNLDLLLRDDLVGRMTPEVHARVLQQWKAEGRDTSHVEDLDSLKSRIRGGAFRAVMPRDYLLVVGVLGRATTLVDLLAMRFWTLLVAPDGTDFVCSDRPVNLLNNQDIPAGTAPRYTDHRFDVIMPISRRLCLVGHAGGQDRTVRASARTVGFINHITSVGATEYTYSASEEAYCSDDAIFPRENAEAYRSDVPHDWT